MLMPRLYRLPARLGRVVSLSPSRLPPGSALFNPWSEIQHDSPRLDWVAEGYRHSLNINTAKSEYILEGPAPRVYESKGDSGGVVKRYFCPDCGSCVHDGPLTRSFLAWVTVRVGQAAPELCSRVQRARSQGGMRLWTAS